MTSEKVVYFDMSGVLWDTDNRGAVRHTLEDLIGSEIDDSDPLIDDYLDIRSRTSKTWFDKTNYFDLMNDIALFYFGEEARNIPKRNAGPDEFEKWTRTEYAPGLDIGPIVKGLAGVLESDRETKLAGGGIWSYMELMRKLGKEPDFEYAKALNEMYEQKRVELTELNEGVEETLAYLKASGIKIGLLTNGLIELREPYVEKFNIQPDVQITSTMGVKKPNQQVYDFAAKVAGCSAEDCILIDNEPCHVKGAVEAGWKGILYGSAESNGAATTGNFKEVLAYLKNHF